MTRSPVYLMKEKARNYDGYVGQERDGFGGRMKVFGYEFVFNADTSRGEEQARVYVENGKTEEPIIDLAEVPANWHVKLPNGDIWSLRELCNGGRPVLDNPTKETLR